MNAGAGTGYPAQGRLNNDEAGAMELVIIDNFVALFSWKTAKRGKMRKTLAFSRDSVILRP